MSARVDDDSDSENEIDDGTNVTQEAVPDSEGDDMLSINSVMVILFFLIYIWLNSSYYCNPFFSLCDKIMCCTL